MRPTLDNPAPSLVRRGGALVVPTLLAVALTAALADRAFAQRPQQSDTLTRDSILRAEAEPASDASPRAAVERYLVVARAGRFEEAAAWLDIPDTLLAVRANLARQFKAVLDRHLWLDLDQISGLATGDTADGLPRNVEQLGEIGGEGGERQPVRLVRSRSPEPRWRFSRATVERIPTWYSQLDDRWLLDHMPALLLRPGPFDLLWWQWLAIPLLIALSALLGSLAARILAALFARVAARTRSAVDDVILARLRAPVAVALSLAFAAGLLPLLSLYQPAAQASYRVLRVAFFVVFFWAVWRLVDVAQTGLARSRWAVASSSSRALLPLAGRVMKIFILALAAVALLSMLGYPVASLIAGLGLGGLALALAAQKTVENLFGAFSIGVDQPFREGDFVRIEDFVGTVEAVGLRSTRFRTLDRTLISIPNGRLADMRLESFAARDRIRLAATIGLIYETTAQQMRTVLAGFERALREHPKIWPDDLVVRFSEFGASSLDIEIMAWFQTRDFGEFRMIRQEILLQFMEIVERAGTAFAFPTQTVHVASMPATPDWSREDAHPARQISQTMPERS